MYEIAICDDDAGFAAQLREQLAGAMRDRGVPCALTVYTDTGSLLRDVRQGRQYALLFLDVVFSETEQGLQLASALRQDRYAADVVIMSADPGYALDSFDVQPLHYLVKPVRPEKLDAALDRFLAKNAPRTLRLSTSRGVLCVPLAEILYFEIYAHEIVIHKPGGEKERCVGTLKQLADLLPPRAFVRPHRSYIVNLEHVSEIVRYRIRLDGGDTVPVSKSLYQQVQRAFIEYAGRRVLDF